MQAVILTAGMGTRLGGMTSNCPKALVRVAGRELLAHVADFLDHPAITERIVVTGYMSDAINRFIDECRLPMRTVHNERFSEGSILSISLALPFLSDDFLVMNADHIYPKKMLAKILVSKRGITAICDFDRKLVADDMKVKLDAQKHVTGIRKTLKEFDGGYIGMTCCEKGMIERYKEGVALARKKEGDNVAVECALAALADNDETINVCDTSGIRWLEVDTQEDLKIAEDTLTNNPGFLS